MVRPGVHVDEDWEIYLSDASEEDAWEGDDSGIRRFYVGQVAVERRDPITGRQLSLRIFSGRVRMREPPRSLREVPRRETSPMRCDDTSSSSSSSSSSSMESDPSEEPAAEENSFSVTRPTTAEEALPPLKGEEWDVTNPCQDEINAQRFVDHMRGVGGSIRADYAEKAKAWMNDYLKKKAAKD